MWGGGRVACPWKDGWRIFLSHCCAVLCWPSQLGAAVRQMLSLAGCWCLSACQISECYSVILLVCLNMARVPRKHWSPHDLAIWTASPRYIFSRYSSIFIVFAGQRPVTKSEHVCCLWHHCDTGMHSCLGCENCGVPVCAPAFCCSAIVSRILRLYRAPGSLPRMESGLWPGDKDGVVFIPASAVPLTVMIFMLLSYLFLAHSVQLISFHQVTIHPLAGAWPGNIRKTCSNLFLANLKFLVSHYVDFFFRLAVFGSSLCHSVAVWHWASYLTFLCLTFFILWLLWGLNELLNEKA